MIFTSYSVELDMNSGEKKTFHGEQKKGLAWVVIPGVTKKTTYYQIWHVPTMLLMSDSITSKTACQNMIRDLLKITDWQTTRKDNLTSDLYEKFKAVEKLYKRI